MDRIQLKKETCQRLFGDLSSQNVDPDQEFMDILQNFMFGEAFHQGELEDKTRELLTVAVLSANQLLPQLRAHVMSCIRIGASQDEIKETIYQCAPYIGFPRVLNAVSTANEAFSALGLEIEEIHNATVTEETRMEKGLETQKSIFGQVIDRAYESSPKNQLHIQEYLSGMCFGDFYTRGVLDLRMRELITLCVLTSLGGCDAQVRAHIMANKSAGNDKDTIVTALTQCLLYVGFPRTLNALSAVNELLPE